MKDVIKILDVRIGALILMASLYNIIGATLITYQFKDPWFSTPLTNLPIFGYLLIILGIIGLGAVPFIVLARIRQRKRKSIESKVFSAAPNWQARYERAIEDAGTSVAELEHPTNIDLVEPTPSIINRYPVLKSKKQVADHYSSIQNLEKKIAKSSLNKHQKNRAIELKTMSEKVIINLQELQDIGQIDENVTITPNNIDQHLSQTHTDRAENKLETILADMRSMIANQAIKLSNEIEDLKIPK